MANGGPISNVYIVNDNGIYDPSVLNNISNVLNVDLGALQLCNIRVSSHGQNQVQGQSSFIDIHQQQDQQRQRKREEKERKKREEEEKKRKMDVLKQKFPFLDENNLDDWRTVFSKCHRSEESIFHKTKAYKAVRRTLDFHHVVVILGYPGEGKTACAKYLVEDYNSHMKSSGPKYKTVFVNSPAEFKQKVDPKSFQVIIVEDIFGMYSVNLTKVETWLDYIDTMQFVVKSGRSKLRLVITCGRHIYERVKIYLHGKGVFQDSQIVDISTDGIGLDPQERGSILRGNAGHVSYSESTRMMAYSSYSGYPLCCKFYNMSKTFRNLGRVFFNDPSKYIPQEIEKVSKFDKTVYGVLIFTALNGGTINIQGKQFSELDQEMWENLKTVFRALQAPVEDLELWILQDAARVLSGVFIMPVQNDHYLMVHHSITEHVLRQFSYVNAELLIEMSSPVLFQEFIKSGQYSEGIHERTFNTYQLQYDVLARRFVFDILQGKLRSCCAHQAFTDEKFVAHFFEYLDRLGNLEALYRARDETGNSLLFWMAWYGRDFVVKAFVEKESLTRMADDGLGIAEQRILALMATCYRGGVTEVRLKVFIRDAEKKTTALGALLNAGVPINSIASMDRADELLNFEFSFLLQSGALPVHFAALGNNGPAMNMMLENGADIDATTHLGETALHLAVTKDNTEVVQHLLEHGSKVDAKTNLGKTPIHDAVYFKKTEIARTLLKSGADVNTVADDDRPLLQVAVANTDIEMLKMLIEQGADVKMKGRDGWTALHEAFYLGDTQAAEYLLGHGADVHLFTAGGITPLNEAVSNGDHDLIDLLLETGFSVNTSSHSGETPLHIAARNGNLELVKKLLDLGAEVVCQDGKGMLPVNIAAASSHSDVMHYLMERSGLSLPPSLTDDGQKRDPYGYDRFDMYDDDDFGPYGYPMRHRDYP